MINLVLDRLDRLQAELAGLQSADTVAEQVAAMARALRDVAAVRPAAAPAPAQAEAA